MSWPTKCPACAVTLSVFADIDEGRDLREGDRGVCDRCGAILGFGPDAVPFILPMLDLASIEAEKRGKLINSAARVLQHNREEEAELEELKASADVDQVDELEVSAELDRLQGEDPCPQS